MSVPVSRLRDSFRRHRSPASSPILNLATCSYSSSADAVSSFTRESVENINHSNSLVGDTLRTFDSIFGNIDQVETPSHC